MDLRISDRRRALAGAAGIVANQPASGCAQGSNPGVAARGRQFCRHPQDRPQFPGFRGGPRRLGHARSSFHQRLDSVSNRLTSRLHPQRRGDPRRYWWYAGAVRFEFYRFRFRFRATGALYFPPYQSGNIVRGAFGSIFRRLTCLPDCHDAKTCEGRAVCPYARVFEPRAARGQGPSGLEDWPRPFVFRASHLDGSTIREGEEFHFDIHHFEVRDPALRHFVAAFAELAREGLGPGRGLARLEGVDQLGLGGETIQLVFDGERTEEPAAPNAVDLSKAPERLDRARVRFVTPTELKSGRGLAERPEFPILFGRLRDRVSTLRALYGGGPLEIDFHGMGERAAAVRMTRCELEWREAERRSTRTGQRHPWEGSWETRSTRGSWASSRPICGWAAGLGSGGRRSGEKEKSSSVNNTGRPPLGYESYAIPSNRTELR